MRPTYPARHCYSAAVARLRGSVLSIALAGLLVIFVGCAPPRSVVEVTETAKVTERPSKKVEPGAQAASKAGPENPYAGVEVGRFDSGKMWTFDNPPVEYFTETYGFKPDTSWFRRARLGALRFSTYCSASFISPSGLIMTNHHCGRESVTTVTRTGEDLLENGFYASNLAEERKVRNLYVEQLIGIEDVTDKIYSATESVVGAGPRAEARKRQVEAMEKRMKAAVQAEDSTLQIQVIALYNGGKYAAYTFRRYDDIYLVMAPELQIGFFGGDYDNFTYPRFNLDMSFFRAYDDDGKPLSTPDYFRWNRTGLRSGDAVFVVGNPGSTSRLSTVSQLEYIRDVDLPESIAILKDRSVVLDQYIREHPDDAKKYDLKNDFFSIQNTLKAQEGELAGLQDGYLIRRRGAAEYDLMEQIRSDSSRNVEFGELIDEIARLQTSKKASAGRATALTHFLNPSVSSRILTRAMYGYVYTLVRQRGGSPDQLKEIRDEAAAIKSWPRGLEQKMIAHRLQDLRTHLGATDPTVRHLLGTMAVDQRADSIAIKSALADSAAFMRLLDGNYLSSNDVTVDVVNSIAPLYFTLDQQLRSFVDREESYAADLSRARFAIYGETMPPDASFSPRIADGTVSGYQYNGTIAPAFTTFYGLYDQAISHSGREAWKLPGRWEHPPANMELSTPLDLVSTNDISGGNSGSPLLNVDLEIVGLVFDGNIESLPNEYLYTDTRARTISVDARGILEALDEIYDADRIVKEILTGQVYETEEEADAAH